MYLRTIQRRNKDGSVVRDLQLAHNVRHPDSGHAVAQVLHSFGREDQLDRDGLTRLVGSRSRYLDLEQPTGPAGAAGGDGELRFVSSKTLGGAWARTGSGTDWAWTIWCGPRCAAGVATRWRSSGCCSRWSRTGRWTQARASAKLT